MSHDTDQPDDASYVAALTREGEGYAAVGREHRLADVNAELKRLGAPPVKGAGKPASPGRGAAAQRQTR